MTTSNCSNPSFAFGIFKEKATCDFGLIAEIASSSSEIVCPFNCQISFTAKFSSVKVVKARTFSKMRRFCSLFARIGR